MTTTTQRRVNSEGCDVADVLTGAAELIEAWGWTTGTMMCADGKMCQEGAVHFSSGKYVSHEVDGGWVYDILDGIWTADDEWVDFAAIHTLHSVGGGMSHNDATYASADASMMKLLEAAAKARREGL